MCTSASEQECNSHTELRMPLFLKGARFGNTGSGGAPERWQVIKKLGEGQFAEVYEVRDTSIKDRDARVSE